MLTIRLTRDTKLQGAEKTLYFGGFTLPNGTPIQTMDPGDVVPGKYECHWLLSPHLSEIVTKRTGKPTEVFAYRLKDAKLRDGSISQNILVHAGTFIEDSLDCFLIGLTRNVYGQFNPRTGKKEPAILQGITAKEIMRDKLIQPPLTEPQPFILEVVDGPGLLSAA